MKYYLAIDIGASSGRHIVAWEENGEVRSEEVHRFPNNVDTVDGHLTWDMKRLWPEIKEGTRKAFAKYPEIESLSIDTWGVDYVLLKGDEEVFPCYAYRDSRTEAVIDEVHEKMPFAELYRHTGIQYQPFNTVYQMYDDLKKGRLDGVTDFLMVPEYLMYKLSGVKAKEYTNATTMGMVNVETGEFDMDIVKALGLPEHLFPKLLQPGTIIGSLSPEIAGEVGGTCKVVLCATHDTGSAVEGIPMTEDAPYISSGTWSLLGVKTPKPINDAGSMKANYSNEGGVGYNRYQKNIMGLWIVNSLRREECPDKDFGSIEKESEESTYNEVFDANAEEFLAPKSMKQAIYDYLAKEGKPTPVTEGDYFRTAYLSLAKSYDQALKELEANTGKTYGSIYVVGGGAKNAFLTKMTEEATGKKVNALPIEATALGNLKIQMAACK